MSISEKNKAINKKIDQNKAQYHLQRQTAKITALSSGNVRKFVNWQRCFTRRRLEKSATMKRFEY